MKLLLIVLLIPLLLVPFAAAGVLVMACEMQSASPFFRNLDLPFPSYLLHAPGRAPGPARRAQMCRGQQLPFRRQVSHLTEPMQLRLPFPGTVHRSSN